MTQSVVITHFYNEKLLLPFWIDHHKRLFNHGVLINYASTDGSDDLARELAPASWEIMDSRNGEFGAADCDLEVMDVERRFPGMWKMALNTTEFILVPNLNEYIDHLIGQFPPGYEFAFRAHGISMIDDKERPLTKDPLIKQRHWGVDIKFAHRDRVIHPFETGQYDMGRHHSHIPNLLPPTEDFYCLWFGHSPYPQVKDRILQVQTRIPIADKEKSLGREHIIDENELDERYIQQAIYTKNLLEDPDFYYVWSRTLQNLYNLAPGDDF